MTVIGLCGRKRSGKNTVANIMRRILESEGYKVQEFAFGDCLKEMVCDRYKLSMDVFSDAQKDAPLPNFPSVTPRDLCLLVGDKERSADDEIFVKLLDKKIQACIGDPKLVILVTDVRLNIEANLILSYLCSGIVFIDADRRLPPMEENAHPTETEMQEVRKRCFATVVNNNLSENVEEDLKDSVLTILLTFF